MRGRSRGIKGGYIDEQQLRLTVQARRGKAKELVDAGMSRREAAKALGVSPMIVQRDVSQNDAKDVSKSDVAKRQTKAEKRADREAELAPNTRQNIRDGPIAMATKKPTPQ
jgi:predicted transcriptional regulator